MAYFHPWTLRQQDAEDPFVPFAGKLRTDGNTWQEALATWLNGNVISEESVRYMNHFLSVYRVRPRDPSEDVLSDEDSLMRNVYRTGADLTRALKTIIGGREPHAKSKGKSSATGKATHEEHSRTGMAIARHIWAVGEDPSVKESVIPTLDPFWVKESLKSARASQRQLKSGPALVDADSCGLQVQRYASCTMQEIKARLRTIHCQKDESEKRLLQNRSQYEMVEHIALQICDEMDSLARKHFSTIGEPLRWSMQGGPGTGKTHVIRILNEELFGKALKWNMAVEFRVVELHAVMADLLGGDTIHHALNIGIFGKAIKSREGAKENKAIDTMKALLRLRWLIIDEICMVSARLFADIDEVTLLS